MKKIAIVGSRNYNNYAFVKRTFLDLYKTDDIEMVVSGGSFGADALAQRLCKELGLSILIHYPAWNRFGRSSGYKRNELIVKDCDELLCFRLNLSKGCTHSLELAQKQGKKTHLYDFNTEL